MVSPDIRIGRGNIICAGCVLSINVKMNDFNVIDWNCTVGHDGDFKRLYYLISCNKFIWICSIRRMFLNLALVQKLFRESEYAKEQFWGQEVLS